MELKIITYLLCVFAVDLFRFFAIAQKLGGYDKVTAIPCNVV